MKNYFSFFAAIVLAISLKFAAFGQNPGDTLRINALNYNSLTRDTVVQFPDLPGITFEKILMEYNMRCHGGAVNSSGGNNNGPNGSNGCGEWDYSCNTYIHDSLAIDSVKATHPSHTISGFLGTTFNYTTQASYTYYQYTQPQVTLNSITSETQYPLLTGTTPTPEALSGSNQSGKAQYLYTAGELNAAGFTAGNIDGFLVQALNGGAVNFLRITIKETAATSLDATSPETTGFTQVFFSNFNFVTGSNRLQFSTPFAWNGTANIIIEFSFTNSTPTTDVQLEGTPSPGMAIFANNEYSVDLSSEGHFDVPVTSMAGISNEITVSFWAFGDVNQLPANTYILEALGANGERDVNIHLPWSNSEIYWDCGGDGSYDRINKLATAAEFEGQWNHWAFVKNATTGIMQIYLNGALWHSGTSKTRPIDIASMVVGKSATYSGNYKGRIDELQIWDKALSATDIQNWMSIPITPAHPEYSRLVAYYPLDEGTGTQLNDASVNGLVATANSSASWSFQNGIKLTKFFREATNRPSIILCQGTYNTTITNTTVMDSLLVVPNTITAYAVVANPGTFLNDDITVVSTSQVWYAIPQSIYDGETGALLGTIPVSSTGTLTPTSLNYFKRSPSRYEIMSFVTPYGIGLNLGPNGKTWTFEMTDYSPIFKGPKRLTMTGGGQWQEEMNIDFLFIVGTPPRDVLDIKQLWKVDAPGYQNILSDLFFEPRDVLLDPNGVAFKIRSAITGHGQEGEFIPRNHYIDIDGGVDEFTWQAWKECAENPVYPQGGTWIYDRAGWCPGMATDVQHWDITSYVTPGQSTNIDYGIQTATGSSNYYVNNQLVTYGAPNHSLDASVIQISHPSNRVEFARSNPICSSPVITIQNTGSTPLTSLTISYWVNNPSNTVTHQWTGNLNFLETEEVTLPAPWSMWNSLSTSANTFNVEVSAPNGGSDEYAFNNGYQSTFAIPKVIPGNFVIWFKTNNVPSESSYEVLDETGTVLFSKSGMAANTLYKDTMLLPMGCYTYRVYDTGDDGLSFFANSDGSGYTRFTKVGAGIVQDFNSNYGDGINFNFTIDSQLEVEELGDPTRVNLYPNPTTDRVKLELIGFERTVEVSIFNAIGQQIDQRTIQTVGGDFTGEFSLEGLSNGIYLFTISDQNRHTQVKVIKE